MALRALAAGLAILSSPAWTTPATAQSPTLRIHPQPGLYGPLDTVCEDAGAVRIAPAFCDVFDTAEKRSRWGRRFAELVTHQFGDHVRADLGDALPDGLSRESMLSRTAVASLHLSRADLWTVNKGDVVEVHALLTLSLLMTNVLTGEVLFSQNLTRDVEGLSLPGQAERMARASIERQLDDAIVELVTSARGDFRPQAVDAVVRARIGDRYIVDAGSRSGLRVGDELGSDARVVFVDTGYAVVEPVLGSLPIGATLTRLHAAPVDALARPSVLVVIADIPADIGSAYLTTVVEDAIAGSGAFALTTVNPSSSLIRDPSLQRAHVSPLPRALPDYFLRVSVTALEPIEAETNIPNIRRRVQEARAFIEVVNHEGRVVHAVQGRDQRIDEISSGMAPSGAQRWDAAIKNAIRNSVDVLRREFNASSRRFDLQSRGQTVKIADPGRALGLGARATIVRRQGRVTGIADEVWIPVAEAEVVDIVDGTATARLQEADAVRLQAGDKALYAAAGTGVPSRQIYAQCLREGRPAIDVRGLEQPAFGQIATNSFARRFRGAVHIGTLRDELARMDLEPVFVGIDGLGALNPRQPDLCFEPVHNVEPGTQRADGRNFTVQSFQLTAGFVLRNGAEASSPRLTGVGQQQTLSATATPTASDPAYRNRSLQIDMAEAMSNLASNAAGELTPP